MQITSLTDRFAFIASLFIFFFLITCSRGEEETTITPLVFPFFNKIYACKTAGQPPEVIHTSRYFYTKYFYQSGDLCWVSGNLSNSRKKFLLLYCIKKNTIKIILSGDYVHIIPVKGMVITISGGFSSGRGFQYNFYKITNDRCDKKALYTIYLDLFLHDIEELSGKIICAGSDRLDVKNYVYLIDPGVQKKQVLFSCPRTRDFIKLIQTEEVLAFYLSLQDWKEQKSFCLWQYPCKDLEEAAIDPPNKVTVSDLAHTYSTFGKGFGEKNVLYIPVIDKQYNCGLFKLCLEHPPVTGLYTMPTGLYFSLPTSGTPGRDNYYVVGYNYYKEKSKFYFLQFSKDISPEAIRERKQYILEY